MWRIFPYSLINKRDSRSVALLHYAEQGGEVWSRAIFRYGMVEIEGF
jgi:hypothetical protein